MTTLTRTITLVTILDGANFNTRMDCRAFKYQDDADAWGARRVEELRAQRRKEGETDEVFCLSIYANNEFIAYQLF